MNITNLFKNAIISLYTSLKRFPVTIGFTTAVTAMLIIITHNELSLQSGTLDMLRRIAMVLALGIPLSLCIKLIFERIPATSPITEFAAYLSSGAGLILYYFLLLTDFRMVQVTRYIAISIALYLSFVFIPYFRRQDGIELYVIELLTRFFVTVLYSGVLFSGLAAVLFTLDNLLSVPVQDKFYFYTWLVTAGIFAPCFFLAGIPANGQKFEVEDYPKLLKILLLYIVMPIIAVYTAILYVYFIKITVTRQWPVGMVGHLVLWYSVVCAGVIFLISPLSAHNKWAKGFIFWFSKLLIPAIAVMFISMGIRIRAYGITENRYFVLLLGLWVLGMMLYLNLSKSRKNIVFPVSLAIIAVLSVAGPWSSYSVSKFSQNMRFRSILAQNNMIKDNSVVKPSSSIPEHYKIEISRIISYFENSHTLGDLKLLPEDFKVDDMQNVFGFPYQSGGYYAGINRFFSYSTAQTANPTDISGYDYLYDLRSYNTEPAPETETGAPEVRYDRESTQLKIFYKEEEIYGKPLSEFSSRIYAKYGLNENRNVDPEDMIFIEENNKVMLKFIFQNIYGEKDESTGEIKFNGMDCFLLVKIK